MPEAYFSNPTSLDSDGVALCSFDLQIDRHLANAPEEVQQSFRASQSEIRRATLDAGLVFDPGHPWPISLRPTIVHADWAAKLFQGAERLVGVLDHVLELYRREGSVRELFSAYDPVREYILRAPSLTPLTRICRLDGMVAPDGSYKILETNSDCPSGFFGSAKAMQIWRSLPNPLMSALPQGHVIEDPPLVTQPQLVGDELISAYRSVYGNDPVEVRVVNYQGRFTSEADTIVSRLMERGIHCELIDLMALDIHSSGRLFHKGTSIDLIYNKWDLRDLVNAPETVPFLEAVASGETLAINPLACQWLFADKTILALFSDPRFSDYFTASDRDLFSTIVPWTRVVAEGRSTSIQGEPVELLDYLVADQARLLIKPTDATWGEGVIVGHEVSSEVWQRAIASAAGSRSYVAQEFIRGHTMLCPDPITGVNSRRTADLNIFVIGGVGAGLLSRASNDSIMSLYKGGAMLPVLVVR